jgi:hypothetical protein
MAKRLDPFGMRPIMLGITSGDVVDGEDLSSPWVWYGCC